MKIIALIPIKNEGWILKTTIPQMKRFADEILCLDAGSTDDSLEYLKSAGVQVRLQSEKKTNYSAWRQELLDWGRERGGTHFIWLDADEAFTTNFLGNGKSEPDFRERLAQMKPGEKFAMQWLCLWKSPYAYRDDESVWSNLYKDFIVCDDPGVSFGNTILHEGRTPGSNTDGSGKISWTKIPLSEGAVLHFQFVPFERFQIKQSYQRCRELTMNTASALRINHKYSQTLDDANARTKTIPSEWLAGITGLEKIAGAQDNWYLQATLNFFKEKGVLFFEPLQIWHVRQLKEAFTRETGREPFAKTYPSFVIKMKKMIDRMRNMLQ